MKKLKILILISLALLLGSCSCSIVYKDISHQRKYKSHIGQQYEVVGRVDIYAIKHSPNGPLEYYTLIPLPGIGGWEVISRKTLPIGTKIIVTKVMNTSRLFSCSEVIFVNVFRENTPPIEARIAMFRGNEKNCDTLNPNLYRRIK